LGNVLDLASLIFKAIIGIELCEAVVVEVLVAGVFLSAVALQLVFIDCLEAPVHEGAQLAVGTSDLLHFVELQGMRLTHCLGEAHVSKTPFDNVVAIFLIEAVFVEDLDHGQVDQVEEQEQ